MAAGSVVARELGEETRAWLVSELRFAIVGVVEADGRPIQSASWFDLLDGPRFLLNTVVGRAKDRCLARDGRVSLLWDDEYESVVVQGRVVERYEGELAKADISHLATRYGIAPERYAAEERVTYVVEADRVLHKRIPVIRLGTVAV